MPSGATTDRSRQGIQPGKRIAPLLLEGRELRKAIEFLSGAKLLQLVVRGQEGVVLFHNGAEAVHKALHFDGGKVRKHHAD